LSRILAYPAPGQGHLFPLVAILIELQRRGHEIALRTLAAEVDSMRALGFDAAPIAAEVEAIPMDEWRARTQFGGMRRSGEVICARARHDAPDLSRAIEEERPEALLVDALTWGALNAAELWGGPWACFAPFPLPLVSRAAPPMGLGWRPARGAPGRWRDRLVESIFTWGSDRTAGVALNAIRADLGLPPLRHTEDLMLVPPLLIYMTAEPFEYPRYDWPSKIVMVGPCVWEPRGGLPPELEAIDRPLALVTTSSEFQDDGRLVRAAIEALAGEPLHLVATMPSAPADGIPLPDNATVLPFAPHEPLLARAACAITHGGMGVTQKALARGVPVCAVPFGRDQLEVARRVELSGAGTRLPARHLRPARLREKVRAAIRCRAGAARIAAAFAAAGGAPAAADAFERMLDARRS
jgi:MGT family glycosyltransferase